jgi:hypothetical protein
MSGILDAYANTQYRPVTTVETGDGDPLSVRTYADMASALNNYKLLVGAPRRGQPCFPYWESNDNSTAAHVVAALGPFYVPDGYSVLRFDVNTRRSAGTASVAWTVYGSSVPYFGDQSPFTGTSFVGDFDSATIVTASDDWKWATDDSGIVIYADAASQLLYITVVAANGDTSSRSEMSFFGCRAELR